MRTVIGLASVILFSSAMVACACKGRSRSDTPPTPPPVSDAPPVDTPAPDGGTPTPGAGKCGGIAGFACAADQKCRYAPSAWTAPHPDAMGECVAETYCDAPKDCEGLIHPMVLGAWACERNQCGWKAGPASPQ